MRLPLENWDLLTKHANPHDRAWTNGDVRELVVLAMELAAVVENVSELVAHERDCDCAATSGCAWAMVAAILPPRERTWAPLPPKVSP
jgi:hypothetical protein